MSAARLTAMMMRQSTEDGTEVVYFEAEDMPVFGIVAGHNAHSNMFVVRVRNYNNTDWINVNVHARELYYA